MYFIYIGVSQADETCCFTVVLITDADESAVEQEPRRSSREIRAPQRYGFRVEAAMKTMPSVGKQVLLDPEAYGGTVRQF